VTRVNKDEGPAHIRPGEILSLFDKLGIKSPVSDSTKAAVAQLANYISNRSVALLLRPEGDLWLGSGVCVRLADCYFVATAKHNLQHNGVDLRISELEVRAREEKSMGSPPRVVRPAVRPLNDTDFFITQGLPMGCSRVLLVGRPVSDMAV
jgi:hypothetical protein